LDRALVFWNKNLPGRDLTKVEKHWCSVTTEQTVCASYLWFIESAWHCVTGVTCYQCQLGADLKCIPGPLKRLSRAVSFETAWSECWSHEIQTTHWRPNANNYTHSLTCVCYIYIYIYIMCNKSTGLFEMFVYVLTTCHLVLQMQPHVISFYGVTSRIRFMFLLFSQVSRNWRNESEPPLKTSPLTCYRQFGTNSIIVLMFVESQRLHI